MSPLSIRRTFRTLFLGKFSPCQISSGKSYILQELKVYEEKKTTWGRTPVDTYRNEEGEQLVLETISLAGFIAIWQGVMVLN